MGGIKGESGVKRESEVRECMRCGERQYTCVTSSSKTAVEREREVRE